MTIRTVSSTQTEHRWRIWTSEQKVGYSVVEETRFLSQHPEVIWMATNTNSYCNSLRCLRWNSSYIRTVLRPSQSTQHWRPHRFLGCWLSESYSCRQPCQQRLYSHKHTHTHARIRRQAGRHARTHAGTHARTHAHTHTFTLSTNFIIPSQHTFSITDEKTSNN